MTATIDMTAISARHTSAESASRTSRRHWAQWRLKAYGVMAILIAAAALVVLVSTIVTKTMTVLTESYVEIDVQIDPSSRDLAKLQDPDPRIRAALNGAWRDGLAAMVPGGEALGRREKGELFSLVSRDAGLELGDVVKADLTLIGEEYQFEALLDDQVQMYRQGYFGTTRDAGSEGELQLSAVEGEENTVALRLAPQAIQKGDLGGLVQEQAVTQFRTGAAIIRTDDQKLRLTILLHRCRRTPFRQPSAAFSA